MQHYATDMLHLGYCASQPSGGTPAEALRAVQNAGGVAGACQLLLRQHHGAENHHACATARQRMCDLDRVAALAVNGKCGTESSCTE